MGPLSKPSNADSTTNTVISLTLCHKLIFCLYFINMVRPSRDPVGCLEKNIYAIPACCHTITIIWPFGLICPSRKIVWNVWFYQLICVSKIHRLIHLSFSYIFNRANHLKIYIKRFFAVCCLSNQGFWIPFKAR